MKKTKSLFAFLALGGLLLSGCEFSDLMFWKKNSEPEEQQQKEETQHNHTWGEWKVDGDYHYRECTVCHEKSEKEHHHGGTSNCEHKAVCEVCGAEYGALDEHQYGEWKSETGNHEQHYHECSICHHKEYADHSFTREVVADEYRVGELNTNCEEGNYYYKSCECGEHSTSDADKFYVANSHDFSLETVLDGDANLASPATCTEPATYYYVCSHCGAFDSNHPDHVFAHGNAKGHHYGELHEEEATFGTYHSNYYFCADCGHYFEPVEEGGVTTYVEKDYDQIFDMSKVQYNDPLAGTEANPYIMKCKEDFTYLRDVMNDTASFAGKFFRLANDVDFNNDAEHPFGTPIGYGDAKGFNGTFDGENHKLMNLYFSPITLSDNSVKSDSLALFSRLTNGTIKNLKIQNVSVKAVGTGPSAQRSSGLVARLSGGTIENVEIMSGSIEGTTECAGIVGCIVTGDLKAVIKNCVNRATIKSIGADHPCLGGILGAVVNAMDSDYEVDGCSNYGYIDAANANLLAYSGGIAGLLRVFKSGTSHVGVLKNNKNFGDVFSTRGTLGGVLGIARDGKVEHNYQSKDAKVTMRVDEVDYSPTQLYAENFTVVIGGANKGMKLGTIAGEVGSAATTEYNCYCDAEGHADHTFADGQPLTDEATCQHEGHNGYAVCSVCGEVFGEIIPQLEHTMEYTITPTTHEHHCTNAGCDYTEGAEPHNMVYQASEHVDATPTSDGLDVYVCSVCGYREEQVLKYKCSPSCTALELVPGIAPTCHTEGRLEHYRCTVCGTLYSDALGQNEITLADTVIPTVAHDYVKHVAVMGFAHSNVEYYACSYADHDASEGEYFVKENDEFVPKTESEIFSNTGSYGLDGYGTEANPYVILNASDLWAFKDKVNDATKIDDVAQNDTFEGKFIKLGADIDVTGTTGMGQIGNHDSRPFSGTFDGDNHTITGFTYSGSDAIGLFSRVTKGTIKDLNLADINVTTTTQRSAGVVARADGATISNVNVISGTINGAKQNGGIVGVVVSMDGNSASNPLRTTLVENCSNAATITGTSEANGGIVGYVHNGNLTIRNCTNIGAVTGASNGTGGVIGASNAGTSYTLIIDGCSNYGTVVGSAYNGGIAGLPRKNSASSVISNCVNGGNVSGGTYVGGIAGAARVNVENCITLSGVVLATSSNSGEASTLNAIGASKDMPGYLVGTQETNGAGQTATVTGYCGATYSVTITSGVADIFADNANIYVWAWGGTTASGGEWYLAREIGANQIKVILPYDVTGMKVARFDPNISPTWDSEWNSTDDIIIEPGLNGYLAAMH